ncbi:MAG: peptidase inhibitor family I36 protein [Propionibacteriaceae bacterium]|nr:peptidase inhibitor family I36 protein [Propionibacteriaceae bacterium]MCL1842032.1 peptidase inhibitor family I36 protein [Propionibacteriaceae bacterium]
MRKSRVAKLAVAAAAATMAVTVITAPPADAADPGPVVSCRNYGGNTCVWWDINFMGPAMFYSALPGFRNWDYSTSNLVPVTVNGMSWNDKMSSAFNNTYMAEWFYQDIYFGGLSFFISGPGWRADFTKLPMGSTTWNDQVSSFIVWNDPY